MSRIYVFSTRWLKRIFGENIDDYKLNKNPQEWDGDTIFHLDWPEQHVKIYGFNCKNWDWNGVDVDEQIRQWNYLFREQPDDEICYILHDYVLSEDKYAFWKRCNEPNTTVYGFKHEPYDHLGKCIDQLTGKRYDATTFENIFCPVLKNLEIRDRLNEMIPEIGQFGAVDESFLKEFNIVDYQKERTVNNLINYIKSLLKNGNR